MNAAVQLAHGAFHFGVAFVANHDELIALFVQLGHFHVHLGHQRAGGVKHVKAACLRLVLNGFAHAVGRKNQRGVRWHVTQIFNKNGALGLEVVDHKGVVHDFVAHINGRAKLVERALDDLDGAVHAGTKAARLGQQDFGMGA